MYTTCSTHVLPMFSPCSDLEFSCTEMVNSMDNLLSYCGLVNSRISTSEKDLPVRCNVLCHHFYLPKVMIQVQTGLEYSAG